MKLSDVNFSILLTFLAVHAVALYLLFIVPFTLHALTLACGVTLFRWLGFSCAVHRYFSHRICRTSRWFQFILGVWATLTMARSPIKFASGHRHHHLYSDSPRDLHSAKQQGVLDAYIGWVVSKRYNENVLGHVDDLKRYAELVWLNKLYFLPNALLLYLLYLWGGSEALAYGGVLSIIFTWHLAFAVTVLFHIVGKPAYETGDDSKNSIILGFLMCGEGWHNNHHANPRSAKLGHEWWQLDLGYGLFWLFERVGLIWSLNKSVGPAHPGIRRINSKQSPQLIFDPEKPASGEVNAVIMHY